MEQSIGRALFETSMRFLKAKLGTSIAVGYFSSGINDKENLLSDRFVSRGWFNLRAGQCETLDNPFNARYMFWWDVANGLNDRVMVVTR